MPQGSPVVAIIGGTGTLGSGLAARWAAAGYAIVIGSRDGARAEAAARRLTERPGAPTARGTSNGAATVAADVVVLTVPWTSHAQILLANTNPWWVAAIRTPALARSTSADWDRMASTRCGSFPVAAVTSLRLFEEEGNASHLTIIVNTGDDFEHLGLYILPDLDTTLYTLAGVVNAETGWGRSNETWSFMEATAEIGGPTWFRLGDRDLTVHVERTGRLRAGESLTAVTAVLAERLGVTARILPMADAPVRTMVESDTGLLAFQEYFVRQQCRPVVRSVH